MYVLVGVHLAHTWRTLGAHTHDKSSDPCAGDPVVELHVGGLSGEGAEVLPVAPLEGVGRSAAGRPDARQPGRVLQAHPDVVAFRKTTGCDDDTPYGFFSKKRKTHLFDPIIQKKNTRNFDSGYIALAIRIFTRLLGQILQNNETCSVFWYIIHVLALQKGYESLGLCIGCVT